MSALSANQSNYWDRFPQTYRAQEIKILAEWISAGESGALVGLDGSGRGTLFSYLCHRPDILDLYLAPTGRQVLLVPVDLTDLPIQDLSTLYRTILRAFYEIRGRFKQQSEATKLIERLYRGTETAQDPFLPQSALRELLLYFEAKQIGIGLVLHYFVDFCKGASLEMTRSMRGLRNSFKRTLFYLISVPQEVMYLSEIESTAPLRGILDTNTVWLGPLNYADAADMIHYRTQHQPKALTAAELEAVLALTGNFPSLIRVICEWWLSTADQMVELAVQDQLLEKPNIQHRLKQIWDGLTQEEQTVLSELAKSRSLSKVVGIKEHGQKLMASLEKKGVIQLVEEKYRVTGILLTAYALENKDRSRGKIWIDNTTRQIYSGKKLISDLPPIPQTVLEFLIENPDKRHSHDDLIDAGWSDEVQMIDGVEGIEGVSTEALYQVVRTIRKVIEPDTSKPQYVINRQGGYQFFPEGRPNV